MTFVFTAAECWTIDLNSRWKGTNVQSTVTRASAYDCLAECMVSLVLVSHLKKSRKFISMFKNRACLTVSSSSGACLTELATQGIASITPLHLMVTTQVQHVSIFMFGLFPKQKCIFPVCSYRQPHGRPTLLLL